MELCRRGIGDEYRGPVALGPTKPKAEGKAEKQNIQNLARLFHGRERHADESVSNKVLTVSNGETWRTRAGVRLSVTSALPSRLSRGKCRKKYFNGGKLEGKFPICLTDYSSFVFIRDPFFSLRPSRAPFASLDLSVRAVPDLAGNRP